MKIGIDLGGSHVAIAIINSENEIVAKKEENFTAEEKERMEHSIVKKIKQNTEQLLQQESIPIEQIEKIGIACPRNYLGRRNCKSTEIWDYIISRCNKNCRKNGNYQ